jgi:hypothetical protein
MALSIDRLVVDIPRRQITVTRREECGEQTRVHASERRREVRPPEPHGTDSDEQ